MKDLKKKKNKNEDFNRGWGNIREENSKKLENWKRDRMRDKKNYRRKTDMLIPWVYVENIVNVLS